MKKLLSLLLALLMASSSAAMITASGAEETAEASLTAAADRVLGDINADGGVDVKDAMDLFQHSMLPDLFRIDYPGTIDFNKDGNVDIADALYLFQYSMMPDMFPIEWGDVADDNPYPVNTLTINGADISEYVIATNAAAGGVMSHAATELQKYIELTTGAVLPIDDDGVEAGTKRILIDETEVTDNEMVHIYNDADGIVLAGSAKRSALYAVYHFAEECLGWTFFATDVETCEEVDTLDISGVDIEYTHAFEIRDIYWTEYFEPDISVKRYQNGDGKRHEMYNSNPESVKYGGSENFHPYGIHTFAALAGQSESTQPCLNDEAVYQKMLNTALAWLRSDPVNNTMIHVSQNDNRNYCTCSACNADLQYYGSPAGSIIKLVNRMDEDFKANGFEDITIITFAYDYSFPCPKNITCNDDIAVELCTIDYCFNHAFDDPKCVKNSYSMRQIKAWSEICSKFYLWDYTVDFKYYLCPFPNFDVLLDNLRVMSTIGAKGIIEQGNYQTVSGEFGALRTYLLAKALENPNMSKEEYYGHMDAFLEAYYGPGWTYVRQFIDLITEISDKRNHCYGIHASPEEIYGKHPFSPYNEQLIEWWDKAEEMAETDLQLEHVRRSRICCDYMRIGSVFRDKMNSSEEGSVQEMRASVQKLYNDCKELGIARIAENCPLPETVDPNVNPRAWWNLHEYKE